MKKFKDYLHLWPEAARASLEKFAEIPIQDNIDADPPKVGVDKCIVVAKEAKVKTLLRLLGSGYKHIVQEDRDDFSFSLLSAALLISQPNVFHANPMTFVLRSAADPNKTLNAVSFEDNWTRSDNLESKVEQVLEALQPIPKVRTFQDHLRLVLGEMSSNSMKDAVTEEESGCRIVVSANTEKIAILIFDRMKSFQEASLRKRLGDLARQTKIQVHGEDHKGGAGIGIPFMIESATDFYLSHKVGSGGITACVIDIRKGFKDLLSRSKNVHIFYIE